MEAGVTMREMPVPGYNNTLKVPFSPPYKPVLLCFQAQKTFAEPSGCVRKAFTALLTLARRNRQPSVSSPLVLGADMARRTLPVVQAAGRVFYVDVPPGVAPPNALPQDTPPAAPPVVLPDEEPAPSPLLASLFGLADAAPHNPDE
ncbi:hypothetical protein FRC12_001701 [Ceratobasidium sp. 428]|nr:hypothetical protein FRC12_001701 [Ceratobasidium sp. 428]